MATPKIIPYTVKLRSVVPEKTFSKPPVVYTNDLRSAEFQFKITDMDASELLTATAKTMLYMRDGSFFQNLSTDVSRVGNVFSYLLKENEGNHAGIAKIQLVVYFNEGLANEQNFPTQLYEFEIINGLETKVAQEVMIYDWTTLTRDARAYIDTFVANETTRQQQFSDAQAQRTTDFGAAQTTRAETFAASEQSRTDAFVLAETARAEGYTADHGRAETDHTTAAADHTTAGTDHTTAAADHTLAASDHATAAADHTIVQGYNTRLTAEETATANNKISAVKGKTFADVDARLEELETQAITVDARTEFEAKNEVMNGDFSNGTTGWNSGAVTNTLSVVDGALRTTAGEKPYVGQVLQTKIPANEKLYILFKARANRAATANIGLSTNTIFGVINQNSNISLTTSFTSYSLILTPTSDIVGVRINGADYTTAGDYIDIDNFVAINLTAAFGSGKEPTIAEMDRLMARFPSSWFDGVKPIQTIETLYQEKANKVQAAWITPTLLNSWVQFEAGSSAMYMKDEFGFVHLKGRVKSGTVGADLFSLPVGYRSVNSKIFPVASNGAFAVVNVTSTVFIGSTANNTYVSLEGITFKAEA